MWPTNQRTLKGEVVIDGIGTHLGKECCVRLLPANPNTGIIFTNQRWSVGADLSNIEDNLSNTTLESEGIRVETVEHLLSCLYGMFVSNAEVEMHGGEIPIGDGSARHFYDAIKEVGIVEQEAVRIGLVITNKRIVKDSSNRFVSISPAKNLIIESSIDWHPNIKGKYTYVHEEDSYADIAYARTYADKSYIAKLVKSGRALGTTIGENCIDIDSSKDIKEECLKHKVLDILGDISLLFGLYVIGKIKAVNSGHALHHRLIKELFGWK
jgi:UDP-3-O-[3-hydroxymyristoyl] N-acetylglucosamine deacetylase